MALFIKYKYYLAIIAFSIVAVWPLFHPGLIPTHDGEYHLIRFYEFDKMLRAGYWYPRWAPDLNFAYGVPLFTYVYPLPNYIASLFHFFGVSFLNDVKYIMALATIVGALFCYLWAKQFWGEKGGLIASIFYTFAPYHFVDIYVRGSIGEVVALGIFPGFLWAYTVYVNTKHSKYAILAGILLALTIFAHNILGLMFFCFAITYMLLQILQEKEKRALIITSVLTLLISLGLSAIFWIPALLETHFVTGLQVFSINQNFPDLFQLLFPSWGTGFFDTDLSNQMSVQVGVANLLAVTMSVFLFIFLMIRRQKKLLLIGFFLAWFVVLFVLMLPISLPLWLHAPLLHYFQFPWRLLSLLILVCAFLAGSLSIWKGSNLIIIAAIIIAIGTTYSYTHPAYYMLRNDNYYTTRSNFIDSTNSPGNVFNTQWGKQQLSRPKERFLTNGVITINKFTVQNSAHFVENVTVKETTQQQVAVNYFPSWHVRMNGKQIPTWLGKNGLLSFLLPKGSFQLDIQVGQTGIERVAEYISVISLIFVLLLLLRKRHE